MKALNKIRYACLVCTLMALVTLAGCNSADRSAEPPQSSTKGRTRRCQKDSFEC